ncbi:hypothetical protein [Peptoniphilus indolicus]|uniref:Uncharacterized protein n=1 Tax=Peptoniphilus indolicus TaxID=33030 RepID=A0A379DDF7_9FIRM|nr:hypothetical protein [Peptoniphilus indolicus]SUB75595.1 Uncharacterised protein [Peptoniphilus indolicus]
MKDKKIKVLLGILLSSTLGLVLVGFTLMGDKYRTNTIDIERNLKAIGVNEISRNEGEIYFSENQLLNVFNSLEEVEEKLDYKFLHSYITEGAKVAYSNRDMTRIDVFHPSKELTDDNILEQIGRRPVTYYTMQFLREGSANFEHTYGGYYTDEGIVSVKGVSAHILGPTEEVRGGYTLDFQYNDVIYIVDRIPSKEEAIKIFESFLSEI